MTSRPEGRRGWNFCDDVWRKSEEGVSKYRDWRHRSLNIIGFFFSVRSWLDVLHCSSAMRWLPLSGQTAACRNRFQERQIVHIIFMTFYISKLLQTGKWFGLKRGIYAIMAIHILLWL